MFSMARGPIARLTSIFIMSRIGVPTTSEMMKEVETIAKDEVVD